jgi:hypothetical protein
MKWFSHTSINCQALLGITSEAHILPVLYYFDQMFIIFRFSSTEVTDNFFFWIIANFRHIKKNQVSPPEHLVEIVQYTNSPHLMFIRTAKVSDCDSGELRYEDKTWSFTYTEILRGCHILEPRSIWPNRNTEFQLASRQGRHRLWNLSTYSDCPYSIIDRNPTVW